MAETQEVAGVEVTLEDPRSRETTKDLAREDGLISHQAKSAQDLRSIRTSNSSRSKSDRDSALIPTPFGVGITFSVSTKTWEKSIDPPISGYRI